MSLKLEICFLREMTVFLKSNVNDELLNDRHFLLAYQENVGLIYVKLVLVCGY